MTEQDPTQVILPPQDILQGSFARLVGYELVAWHEDAVEVRLAVGEDHMNRSGVLHGGALTTLIDAACGYSGCYSPDPARPRKAVTLSLTCNFVSAVQAGVVLTARARKTGGGRQIYFSDCKVEDQNGRLVAEGSGVFKYRRGSEAEPK